MIFGDDRNAYRKVFFEAWKKYLDHQALSDLEKQLVQLISVHPEYHFIFEHPEKYLHQDFFPELGETNPFLHLSLHLGLIEQLSTNLPHGIRELYQKAILHFKDPHDAEHSIMAALIEELNSSQKEHREFSNTRYFELVKRKINVNSI